MKIGVLNRTRRSSDPASAVGPASLASSESPAPPVNQASPVDFLPFVKLSTRPTMRPERKHVNEGSLVAFKFKPLTFG